MFSRTEHLPARVQFDYLVQSLVRIILIADKDILASTLEDGEECNAVVEEAVSTRTSVWNLRRRKWYGLVAPTGKLAFRKLEVLAIDERLTSSTCNLRTLRGPDSVNVTCPSTRVSVRGSPPARISWTSSCRLILFG